jgi:hypothetical protein
MTSYNLKGVEIFSAGTWNGDKYTVDDLHGIVEAFNETKGGVQPYLKLGHDKDQKLIAGEKDFPQRDGKPAAGWIDRVYVIGDRLKADFSEVPKTVYDLIQKKAYKKVSCEMFWNIKLNNKIYKKMLTAVALLGANTPGVMNLQDILAMYSFEIGDGEMKLYNVDIDIETKPEGVYKMELEQVQKEYNEKIAAQNAEIEKNKADLAALQKQADEFKQYKADAEKRQIELEQAAEVARNEKFFLDLSTNHKASPAMKPYIMEILGSDKKEYAVGDKKHGTKQELITETLKLYAAALEVNLDENSTKGKDESAGEAEMLKKVDELVKNEGLTYAQAVVKAHTTNN